MHKHFFLKGPTGALYPADELATEAMQKIANGDVIQVTFSRPRNVKFHRLYFALINLVWNNVDREIYPTVDDLRHAIQIQSGHRTRLRLKDGSDAFMSKSISFASMDEDSFGAFFNNVCDLISTHWLPGVSSRELRMEVEAMIGG